MTLKNFTNIKIVVLSLIVLIAIILRFYQLGSVPISPDWDEAALGYNAYSILQTGKDEHGKFLPVILESFGDYKPALYAYLAIPSIVLFGLNTFAVRVPAAIIGVIGVLLVYFLVRQLFISKDDHSSKFTECLALLSAFLFAISPWDIQFSRVAFEAQVGMVLNIGAILFFLKGLRNGWYLSASAVFASASVYMYQSEKVYLPILFIVLAIIYWKELVAVSKKYIFLAIFSGLILCLPMFTQLIFDQGALSRAKGVSVFSQNSTSQNLIVKKVADDHSRGDYLGLVLDNRRLENIKLVISGYISHFNPNWLFITGDSPRHHAPGMGLLYLVELPFLLMGMYLLAFGKFSKKTKLTIFAIFLIAPIPASVTSDVPHAVRTINFLPTFQIFTALGVVATYSWISSIKYEVFSIKQLKVSFILYTLFLILAAFNFLYYINQYFVQQNNYYAWDWQYGYEQAINHIKPNENKYTSIFVSNERPLDQSYIFFLYYLKYPPSKYQDSSSSQGFGKYIFKSIDKNDYTREKSLFVTGPQGLGDTNPNKIIYNSDGSEMIKIFEN